jgi:acyl dehydratase
MPFDPERIVALRRIHDVVFKAPTRFGDAIRVDGAVTETRAVDDERGIVACRLRVRNQHDALLIRGAVELVWRRDPAALPADTRDLVGQAL